ncbi:MAG: hypothetical protein H6Q84_1866 [Deltaproteobacteria bacterium]|nr:hypothetical protein [Deltaproteobacteria bacterium]
MSDTFPRNLKGVLPALLLLLAASAFPPGCKTNPPKPALDAATESLLEANGDTALRDAVRNGGKDPFAVLVAFRKDVFLGFSAMIEQSPYTLLNEFGNAAILLVRPNEVVPLLKTPSVRRAAWVGPQGRLARLDPSLEYDLLDRFGKGTEGAEVQILARFRSVPEKKEEALVQEAGFKILSRVGPNLILSGPISRIPKLLDIDWIVYLEKGTGLL